MHESLANVAAYASFGPAQPFDSRQLVHNLNRIWSTAQLDGDELSPELVRARQLRPAVAAADHILDIHSTSRDVSPFWVYPQFERNAAVARDPRPLRRLHRAHARARAHRRPRGRLPHPAHRLIATGPVR